MTTMPLTVDEITPAWLSDVLGADVTAVTAEAVGDVVGWSWLFPPYRWTTDLRAVEPARVVAIEGLCLREKCQSDPAFGFRMMMRFARLMIEQIDAMRLQLLDMYGGASAG